MSEYAEWLADNKTEETKTFSAYPSLYSIGHKAITELLLDPVSIEEKVDGSQFSAGVTNGTLQCRSKRCVLDLDEPEKLFKGAVETFKRLHDERKLRNGWVYRGEAIQTPKHNTLVYSRVPKGNVVIFDIMVGPENYLGPDQKRIVCEQLGLEVVLHLFTGVIVSPDDLHGLLERESFLGGTSIEGLVIKNYNRFGYDKKPLFGKYVSEKFKEVHAGDWVKRSPGTMEICDQLVHRYRTPQRWEKAIFHMRDDGKLTNTPKDIGPLMKEVMVDVEKECKEEIKEILYKWAWERISRALTHGLPQFYKDRLMDSQFQQAE